MDTMRRWSRVAAIVVAAAAWGCGLDLDGTAGSGNGAADASLPGVDASLPGVDAASDSFGLIDSAASDAGTSGSDASDATLADANPVDAGLDTGAPPDAIPLGDPGVRCGNTFCSAPSQYCCKAGNQYTCLAAGVTCAGASIVCDDRVECTASNICCAHLDGQGRLTRVDCIAPGSCNGNSTELCDPDASTCPAGSSCKPTSPELQGFFECN
jgi:hypothetical protein